MPDTFVKIASVTVGSGGASSASFSSIPATYTDLVIKASTRSSRSATNAEFFVRFNGVTFSGSYRLLQGNGSAAASSSGSSGLAGVTDAATNTANTFGSAEIYIPNYASSNNKSYSIEALEEENSSAVTYMYMIAGLWSNTSAITSIELYPEGSTNWVQYSTFTLYGIKSS